MGGTESNTFWKSRYRISADPDPFVRISFTASMHSSRLDTHGHMINQVGNHVGLHVAHLVLPLITQLWGKY